MTNPFEGGAHPPQSGRERERKPELTEFVPSNLRADALKTAQNELAIMMENPERYIDRGGAATVHRLASHVCAEVLELRETSPHAAMMKLGNPVQVEAGILHKLRDLQVDGVRVPLCYGFWRDGAPGAEQGILMEELEAVNCQHVINKTAKLPDGFDLDRFLDALESFIDAMHLAGVAHGDLEARNVMIDRTTRLPRVIDFGRGAELSKLPEPEQAQRVGADDKQLEKLVEVLAKTLTK